jgi:hypothetical protein
MLKNEALLKKDIPRVYAQVTWRNNELHLLSALSYLNVSRAVDVAKLQLIGISFNNRVPTIVIVTAVRAVCHWNLVDMLSSFTFFFYPVPPNF